MDDSAGRRLEAAEIAEINVRHLITTPVKPADLLFVFGTRRDEVLRAETACRLWHERMFRWAIVSGGVTPGSHLSECAVIKPLMVQGGVPADVILEEHCATNTGENAVFSLPVIDAALGLKNVRSVICLGNTWTGRRYAMTLQRYWPEVEKMLVTVDHFATPRERWHEDPEFRHRVLVEWDKIEPYKAKGFIAEWPVRLERDEMKLNRHCERSEAIHPRNEEWIASSLLLLAMTAGSVIEPKSTLR